MKNDFKKIAEKFIEYLKNGDFEKNFDFVLNDGTNNFHFGTGIPHCGFDNWIFITCMYGDGSATTASLLTFENVNNIEEDWDDYLDFFTDYYYNNYKDWNPIIDV